MNLTERILTIIDVLEAVCILNYHDKNFLCNAQIGNKQMREYLQEMRNLMASIQTHKCPVCGKQMEEFYQCTNVSCQQSNCDRSEK